MVYDTAGRCSYDACLRVAEPDSRLLLPLYGLFERRLQLCNRHIRCGFSICRLLLRLDQLRLQYIRLQHHDPILFCEFRCVVRVLNERFVCVLQIMVSGLSTAHRCALGHCAFAIQRLDDSHT